jgi:hypothetical protein
MCWRCEKEDEFLDTIHDLACEASLAGSLPALIEAIVAEETDRDMRRHLAFIAAEMPVEGTLVGCVYLTALQTKARLQ